MCVLASGRPTRPASTEGGGGGVPAGAYVQGGQGHRAQIGPRARTLAGNVLPHILGRRQLDDQARLQSRVAAQRVKQRSLTQSGHVADSQLACAAQAPVLFCHTAFCAAS